MTPNKMKDIYKWEFLSFPIIAKKRKQNCILIFCNSFPENKLKVIEAEY